MTQKAQENNSQEPIVTHKQNKITSYPFGFDSAGKIDKEIVEKWQNEQPKLSANSKLEKQIVEALDLSKMYLIKQGYSNLGYPIDLKINYDDGNINGEFDPNLHDPDKPAEISINAKQKPLDKKNTNIWLLSTALHEFVHAGSKIKRVKKPNSGDFVVEQIGLQIDRIIDDKDINPKHLSRYKKDNPEDKYSREGFGTDFNEGVTDWLARYYAKNQPNLGTKKPKSVRDKRFQGYDNYVNDFELIRKKVGLSELEFEKILKESLELGSIRPIRELIKPFIKNIENTEKQIYPETYFFQNKARFPSDTKANTLRFYAMATLGRVEYRQTIHQQTEEGRKVEKRLKALNKLKTYSTNTAIALGTMALTSLVSYHVFKGLDSKNVEPIDKAVEQITNPFKK
jgi:hypothetical protein